MLRYQLLCLLFSVLCLSLACERKPSKEQVAADAALKALRKLEAATQVGVSYQQYGQLLIDAKAQVNEASTLITRPKLKDDINWIMDAFTDAGKVWAKKVKGDKSLFSLVEPGKELIPKYSLKTEKMELASGKEFLVAETEDALQQIWMQAILRLNQLSDVSR